MKIKSYKLFLEELNMKPEIDLFSSQVELYNCGDHIWAIKAEDSNTRALMFMRPQEYYESSFEEIINKQFKVSNVVLPAYVKSNGAVRKLVIDFTFESSNKYIKEYKNLYFKSCSLNFLK